MAHMIPHLAADDQLSPLYRTFLEALPTRGFRGEIRTDYASRLIAATDNSVYQLVPGAVVFPRHEADVQCLLSQLGEPQFQAIKVSPRGGGTGTNGQALCEGIVIDVSRHMNSILEINLDASIVRVQPGVVLDQLNDTLRPHGVFFAPNLSPSNRATLGGMIATDACGQGSRVYGKTGNHLLKLRSVLLGGSVLESQPLKGAALDREVARTDLHGTIYRTALEIVTRRAESIRSELPKLKRFLTGYDLAHVLSEDGSCNLNSLLCGSEGTLAITTEATLRLTPLPKAKVLIAIRYSDFDAALRAANVLVASNPGSIETVDEKIVTLARKDTIWHSVEHLIEAQGEAPLAAVNLVEFEGADSTSVEQQVTALVATLVAERGQPGKSTGFTLARAAKDISALWSLRKKGVGLLGNTEGERRPVPFVEDTAVPPERLADYIRVFAQSWTAMACSTGCSDTSMSAACMFAQRSTCETLKTKSS
jgi:FAD/FMN-containing dehydrogenase